MTEVERIFDQLPGMRVVDGLSYHPTLRKDCDGYYSALYQGDGGKFLYSDGAGYGTPELALSALLERLKRADAEAA